MQQNQSTMKWSAQTWRCDDCGCLTDELLTAANPFAPDQTISGCPECGSVDALQRACDVPGCGQRASQGVPVAGDYYWLCPKHAVWK